MKLNFWQILGIVCILVGLWYVIFKKDHAATQPAPPAATTTLSP